MSWNDGDALVGDMDLHSLADFEPGLLQPITTKAQQRNLRWTRPPFELIVVAGASNTEQAQPVRNGNMSSHGGLLVDRSMSLLFREVVGYLNTATRRPAAFPLQVLYGCALPDHSRKLQAQKNRRLSGTVSPLVEVCSAPDDECSDDSGVRSMKNA
jgi:hypothetical protein